MIIPSIAALLLLLQAPARGQTSRPPIDAVEIEGITINVGPMADNEKAVQWKVLAARNGIDSPKALTTTARKNLTDTDKLRYHFQRVEVTGVMSVDDTDESEPDMFDKQVKPSHFNETLPSRIPLVNRLKKIFAFGTDMKEAVSDTRGIPTARSQVMIDKLKGQRINELFAHSWGTEIVYLGLLNGDIIPPKKLFIVGVPEANQEKWLMLAKFTGIEVHVVGFEWDKLKVAGNQATKLKSGLPRDTAGLDKLWRENCALRDFRGCADPAQFVRTKFDYNIDVRPPDAPKDEFFKMHLSKLDHDRMLYYRYLYERKLFNKTAAQMDAPQLKLVKAEENRILSAAMDKAQSLIAQAREQVIIARREHDVQLKNSWADISRRSCANPGSITQAELDGLPKSNGTPVMNTTPRGLGECAGTAYSMLTSGTTAEELRRASTPVIPINIQPIQQQAPIRQNPGTPGFPSGFNPPVLPDLRQFSITACRAPDQARIVPLYSPDYNYAYKEFDDKVARSLASGLDGCARKLFYQLIEMIRAREYWKINGQWIRTTVASYKGVPSTSPNYPDPPGGGTAPPSQDDGCGTDPNGVQWCWK